MAGLLAPTVSLVLLLTVPGCAAETGQADRPQPVASDPQSGEAGVVSETADQSKEAEPLPHNQSTASTEAEVAAGAVSASLENLAAGSPNPSRAEMVSAFVDAGIAGDAVEVSLDVTPTGLEVDAIQAAAAVSGTCVVVQIRDGQAVVSLLLVLASGQCFVGDQR